MRHGKKFNHLSRKKGHRKALLKNMSIALIEHKRIRTTVAKAKALRKYFEPLVTRAVRVNKSETIGEATHHRRIVFSHLQDKESVKTLFGEIAMKVGDRPGGYVRILRTGFRQNDAADMCIIELVDYNTDALETQTVKKKRTRRSRRKKSDNDTTTAVATDGEDAVVDNASNEEEE